MPGLHAAMRRPVTRVDCTDCGAYIACAVKGKSLATLTIRNVDPEVQKRVRVRAAENGRSMEAELRQIIKDAVSANTDKVDDVNLAEAIRRRFARYGGVELEIPLRDPAGPPRVKFDE